MERSWHRFINYSVPTDHGVQIYRDASELADSVVRYFASGFEDGEPALAIAVPEHWGLVESRLAALGWSTGALERSGQLLAVDAEETLARVLVDGMPSSKQFDRVVGGLVRRVAKRFPQKQIRAFGEMVDVLSRDGRAEAAFALEEEWHRLALEQRNFSLLCGYQLDVFDPQAQSGVLPHVCRAHSHVLPAHDPERLHRAVDGALEETLGIAGAGRVYTMIAGEIRRTPIPAAQLALMWVTAELPALAQRVLSSARSRYLHAAA